MIIDCFKKQNPKNSQMSRLVTAVLEITECFIWCFYTLFSEKNRPILSPLYNTPGGPVPWRGWRRGAPWAASSSQPRSRRGCWGRTGARCHRSFRLPSSAPLWYKHAYCIGTVCGRQPELGSIVDRVLFCFGKIIAIKLSNCTCRNDSVVDGHSP